MDATATNISTAFGLPSCLSKGALSSRRQRAIEGAGCLSWEGNKGQYSTGHDFSGKELYWVVISKIFVIFTPDPWGDDPI